MARVWIEATWRSTRVFERQRKREEQLAKGFTVFSAGMGFIIGIKTLLYPGLDNLCYALILSLVSFFFLFIWLC